MDSLIRWLVAYAAASFSDIPVLLIIEFFLAIQLASIQRSASRRSYSGIPLLYIPWFTCSVILGLLVLRPLLVVMRTTPLAARLPYNAAEAASFKMDMLSISLEFSSAMFPSKGTPSTTYRGSDDALIDRLPRIRIDPTVPGRSLEVISTPAALPCKASKALFTGLVFNSSEPTRAIAPVTSLFFWTP